jgi:hypothetical protein
MRLPPIYRTENPLRILTIQLDNQDARVSTRGVNSVKGLIGFQSIDISLEVFKLLHEGTELSVPHCHVTLGVTRDKEAFEKFQTPNEAGACFLHDLFCLFLEV